jgi:hypothetical protein
MIYAVNLVEFLKALKTNIQFQAMYKHGILVLFPI